MEKFISFEKLSKKKKRELNNAKRGTWGALNPITRKSENPKAYNRKKVRRWSYDDHHDVLFSCAYPYELKNSCDLSGA